jgi:hypothetical protein
MYPPQSQCQSLSYKSLSSVKTQWCQCPSCGAAKDFPSIDIAERAAISDGNGDAIDDFM